MEISRISFHQRHTRIRVRFQHQLYSSQVPDLSVNLLNSLPKLKEHLCYNRNNLPFADEIEDTELGHAFEHVILALLEQRGMYVRGNTTWNWEVDPIGTYQITINTGKKYAVKECILLAQAIFTNAMHGPLLSFRTHTRQPATAGLLGGSTEHHQPLFTVEQKTPRLRGTSDEDGP